jgi:hypothetical protein
VAEWSKALAWKVSIRQNRIEGSNPSRSATTADFCSLFALFFAFRLTSKPTENLGFCSSDAAVSASLRFLSLFELKQGIRQGTACCGSGLEARELAPCLS